MTLDKHGSVQSRGKVTSIQSDSGNPSLTDRSTLNMDGSLSKFSEVAGSPAFRPGSGVPSPALGPLGIALDPDRSINLGPVARVSAGILSTPNTIKSRMGSPAPLPPSPEQGPSLSVPLPALPALSAAPSAYAPRHSTPQRPLPSVVQVKKLPGLLPRGRVAPGPE